MRLNHPYLIHNVLRSTHAAVLPLHRVTAACTPHLAARLCASRSSESGSVYSDTFKSYVKQPMQRGRPRKTRLAESAATPSSTGLPPSDATTEAAGAGAVINAGAQQTILKPRRNSNSRSSRTSSRAGSSQGSSTNTDSSTAVTRRKQARKRGTGSTTASNDSSNAGQSMESSAVQQQQLSTSSASNSILHSVLSQTSGAGAQPIAPPPAATAAGQAPGDEDKHAEGVLGSVPPQDVWARELRQFQNMMLNPARPQVKSFVLQHCYVLNSAATRGHYSNLEAAQMHKVIKTRTQLERRLSLAANSLSAAWQRLQYLAAAVADTGAVLTEEQLNKEREKLVDVIEGMKDAQVLLERAATVAGHAADQHFLNRAHHIREVLTSFRATAESYLREFMRRIAAASRINEQSKMQWEATPFSKRLPLHEVELRRQQQLQQLQALTPLHPTQLLAEYRQVALGFELYKDKSLFQRKPASGMPSSTGGEFWRQQQRSSSSSPAAPLYATTGGNTNSSSSYAHETDTRHSSDAQQRLQQQLGRDGVSEEGDYTSGRPSQQPQDESSQQVMQQQQQLWGSPLVGGLQPHQQLMARPVQQLPLLPHLGKHRQWMHLLLQQQQQQQQPQQPWQQQQQGALAPQQVLPTKHIAGGSLLSRPQRPFQQQKTLPEQVADLDELGPTAGSKPGSSTRVVSLSGKVLPPVAVLLQRAIKIEQQLLQQEVDKQGSR